MDLLFLARTVVENDIQVKNREIYNKTYDNIYKNKHIEKLMNNLWSEQFVVKIYPNLQLSLKNGKNEMVQDYYRDVQPYYYKFELKK